MGPDLPPLPAGYVRTRRGLHALAEQVLAPLRHRAEGRIGLRPVDGVDGGFGPPLPGRRRVEVVADELHDGDRSTRITTLGDAGRFLDAPVGATDVYAPTTDADPDRDLGVERSAAELVGRWFAAGAALLDEVVATASAEDDPTDVQLWPEHFDLALAIGPPGRRANVGVSPGDDEHDEPYVYVGPWEPRPGAIWNEPWGASLGYEEIRSGADAAGFIRAACTSIG